MNAANYHRTMFETPEQKAAFDAIEIATAKQILERLTGDAVYKNRLIQEVRYFPKRNGSYRGQWIVLYNELGRKLFGETVYKAFNRDEGLLWAHSLVRLANYLRQGSWTR